MAGLSKGGCRALGLSKPSVPLRSLISTRIFPVRRSTGNRSTVGSSHQSISPVCMAEAAVAWSGMTCHSTRSTKARSIFTPEPP